jgi:hypothetical protein
MFGDSQNCCYKAVLVISVIVIHGFHCIMYCLLLLGILFFYFCLSTETFRSKVKVYLLAFLQQGSEVIEPSLY